MESTKPFMGLKTAPTIRVYIPRDSLEEFKTYIKNLSEKVALSLAPPVFSLDDDWVATISFQSMPETFRDCMKLVGDSEKTISINIPMSNLEISADIHFHGLTPLNHAEAPSVDLVAVTGLAGHAFGSWKAHGKHDMWLRDYLPVDLEKQSQQTRIMIYGYDSKLAGSINRASLHDYATRFLQALKSARLAEGEKRRPLILLGHSLGGLVIKNALNEAKQGSNDDKMIFGSCYALLFFGVPNRGMDISTLRTMVKGQPNDRLVNDLATDSQLLPNLERDFYRRFNFKDSQVISFYETKDTPTAEFSNGRWQRTGPPIPIVSRPSAIYTSRNEQIHDQLPIDGDHSSMVKFLRNSEGYRTVRDRVLDLVKKAPTVVENRIPRNRKLSDEEEGCLKSLSFPEMDARRQNIEAALDDTCTWLFERPEYQDWHTHTKINEHHGLLWIKGKPGAGKSTLMKRTLHEQQKTWPHITTASFFFNARGATLLEKNDLGLFQSLLHQLLRQIRPLLSKFVPIYREKHRTQREIVWHVEELQEFFRSSVTTLETSRITIFIDALDECDETQVRKLVSFFEKLTSTAVTTGAKLSICFSSRHYPNIRINNCFEISIDDQNDHDISMYVYRSLRLSFPKERSTALENEIVRKASGIFLWVVLVVELLMNADEEGEGLNFLKKKLQEVPSGLDDLFSKIFDKIDKRLGKLPETLRMMQLVLFAEREINPTELCHAVDFRTEPKREYRQLSDDDDNRMENFIRGRSGGLIEVKRQGSGSAVQFIHESIREYLVQGNGFNKLDPSSKLVKNPIGESHNQLCLLCIEYIDIKELEIIDLQRDFDITPPNSSDGQLLGTYPFLDYAINSLFVHAKRAETHDIKHAQTLVKVFQEQNYRLFCFWRYIYDCRKRYRFHGPQTTLLHIASEYNLQSCVQILLNSGIDVNIRGGYFKTALNAAAYRYHRDMVQALLDKGAAVYLDGREYGRMLRSVNKKDFLEWRDPPWEPIRNGEEEIIRYLMDFCKDGKYGIQRRSGMSACLVPRPGNSRKLVPRVARDKMSA